MSCKLNQLRLSQQLISSLQSCQGTYSSDGVSSVARKINQIKAMLRSLSNVAPSNEIKCYDTSLGLR